MKTKQDIVADWLPRYTGRALENFSKYIILTNFDYYLELFAEKFGASIVGEDKNMPNATANGLTMINFGMGSPNAATILDLLTAVEPEAVLPPSKAKEPPTTICRGKCPPSPPSPYKKLARKPSSTTSGFTTRESSTPRTGGSGNSTSDSKNIW